MKGDHTDWYAPQPPKCLQCWHREVASLTQAYCASCNQRVRHKIVAWAMGPGSIAREKINAAFPIVPDQPDHDCFCPQAGRRVGRELLRSVGRDMGEALAQGTG